MRRARRLLAAVAASATPMQMSLDYLRKLGYFAESVEQSGIHVPGIAHPIKRDLLGFADIIGLREHVLLVQTTSTSNMSARMRKIQSSEAFEPCKRAGILIYVHGWGAGGLRVVDMSQEKADWSAILRRKRKGRFVTQADLEL